MKYLIFADLHSFQDENLELIQTDFDVIILLGDIRASYILKILIFFPEKKVFGILGNHDDQNLFQSVNSQVRRYRSIGLSLSEVININGIQCSIGDRTTTGFEGAPSIIDSELLLTQTTAGSRVIPWSEILFSHETGYQFPITKNDITHEGFQVVSNYIVNNKPQYHIFGHHHQNVQFQILNTQCFGVYGCSIFDSNSGTIKNIFEV